MPVLSDDEGLRVLGQYRLPERPEKPVGNLVRHIQPPAVHAKISHPVHCHTGEIAYNFRIARIQLWHIFHAAESAVGAISIPEEPVMVGRFFAVFTGIQEKGMA